MTADLVMIHVRFAADGSVVEISERPKSFTAQQWFNELSEAAPDQYQALAGGRGIFRLAKARLEAARTKVGAPAAA